MKQIVLTLLCIVLLLVGHSYAASYWQYKQINLCNEIAKGTPYQGCQKAIECLTDDEIIDRLNELMETSYPSWMVVDENFSTIGLGCNVLIKRKVEMP